MTQPSVYNRAVIVCRVSTDVQAEEGTSLETQLEVCRKKAVALGLTVVAEYTESVSGAYLSLRTGMRQAIADIQSGRASCLITMNMSRFSRDSGAAQTIKRSVENAGGKLVFTDIALDATPEGDLAFGIFSNFAAYERQVITKRTSEGRIRRALAGIQPARGFVPWGYERIVSHADVTAERYPASRLGEYIVDETKVRWIQEIFAQYDGGTSLRSICRYLEANKVPTPRHGEYWRPSTVKRLVQNGAYYGVASFRRLRNIYDETSKERGLKSIVRKRERDRDEWIDIPCAAIVSKDVWDRCQVRLAEGRARFGGNPIYRSLLSGLLLCPKCQRSMCGRRRTRVFTTRTVEEHQYSCPDSRPSRNPGKVVCQQKTYDAKTVEQIVYSAISRVVEDPLLVARALDEYRSRQAVDEHKVDVTSIRRSIAELESREDAIARAQIDALTKGRSTKAYEAILDECSTELSVLRKKLGEHQVERAVSIEKSSRVVGEDISTWLRDVSIVLGSTKLETSEKRALLSQVVQKIVPREDGFLIDLKPIRKHGREQSSNENSATVANVSKL